MPKVSPLKLVCFEASAVASHNSEFQSTYGLLLQLREIISYTCLIRTPICSSSYNYNFQAMHAFCDLKLSLEVLITTHEAILVMYQ